MRRGAPSSGCQAFDVLHKIMLFLHPAISDDLVRAVVHQKNAIEFSVHGLSHWQRVERNALFLAAEEGGDMLVASLFALFHDSRRINDFEDPEHGARGGVLASEFFATGRLPINEPQMEVLVYACEHHTDEIVHGDTTIQCCWDGDRLDLTRIGVIPDPMMLNTETAKRIAKVMDYSEIENFTLGEPQR